MKEILDQYTAYNFWANKTITDLILTLDAAKHQHPLESSFPTLHATVLHMWVAETAWLQRIKRQEKIMIPTNLDNPTMQDVVNGLIRQSVHWEEWVNSNSEMMLKQEYVFQNSKNELFKQAIYETVMHVMNHSTYHRGQLVTMMRTLGIKTIPQTDFMVFIQKKKN
jgi:uncharacterized damage-inducible protein DinB